MDTISCRQLGAPEFKDASWKAANEWWEWKRAKSPAPTDDERIERATRVSRLAKDFDKLDEASRHQALKALLGEGKYEHLKSHRDAIIARLDTPTSERMLGQQVEAWKNLLRSACHSGQMSEGRFDAYERKIKIFVQ